MCEKRPWTLLAWLAASLLLASCTQGVPFSYEPQIVKGLTETDEMVVKLAINLRSQLPQACAQTPRPDGIDCWLNEPDARERMEEYTNLSAKLQALRTLAAARPIRTSFIDKADPFIQGAQVDFTDRVTTTLDAVVPFKVVRERIKSATGRCAPGDPPGDRTSQYSVAAIDNAIFYLDAFWRCNKTPQNDSRLTEGLSRTGLDLYEDFIRDQLRWAILLEQQVKTQ